MASSRGFDEEQGWLSNGQQNLDSSSSTSSSSSGDKEDNQRDTSFQTNVSYGEMQDQVSELSSLVRNGGRISPFVPIYGSSSAEENNGSFDAPTNPRQMHERTISDESILTVAELPGMTIRAHSIQLGQRGNCTIRHSTAKVALRSAQLERRGFRSRQQRVPPLPNKPQQIEEGVSTAVALPVKDCYWVDIETLPRSSEELYEFLKQLRLPKFFLGVLCEPNNWTSEVVALKFVTLAMFQILPNNPESDEITYVALLSMPRLLVTFSTCTVDELASFEGLYQLVSQYMRQKERISEPSNTGLLLSWLQFHVQRTNRAIRELRVKTLQMDQSLDRDFANFDFEELVEVKNCLLRVVSVAEEQHGTIEVLAGAEGSSEGLDFANCQGALSVLRASAASNERLSSRVDKHVNELRERIMAHREQTLNQRLALLTILSAIFMPLTLLSGIWGMNFEGQALLV